MVKLATPLVPLTDHQRSRSRFGATKGSREDGAFRGEKLSCMALRLCHPEERRESHEEEAWIPLGSCRGNERATYPRRSRDFSGCGSAPPAHLRLLICGPMPGQESGEIGDFVIVDLRQHIGKPGLRIDTVEPVPVVVRQSYCPVYHYDISFPDSSALDLRTIGLPDTRSAPRALGRWRRP
jgi:hypothetical protein